MTTTTNTSKKIPAPKYQYFKAITPEAVVNTKNRFDKNQIEWIEDITYRNTGNLAYLLKIPANITNKPPGCKRMYFIKYYPGPNEECIPDAEAAIFYTTIYPRYEHVVKHILDNSASLIPWNTLDESHRQHFTKIWGNIILDNLNMLNTWKIQNQNTTNNLLYKRPINITSVEDEHLELFTSNDDTHSRINLEINCDKKDLKQIANALSFTSPNIYITNYNNYV